MLFRTILDFEGIYKSDLSDIKFREDIRQGTYPKLY